MNFRADPVVALENGGRIKSPGECAITCLSPPAPVQPLTAQPRALGHVEIGTKSLGARSVLSTLHQSGAFKALFPTPRSAALEAILINTAGGITGGDRFSCTLETGRGSTLRVTTQAAERAYRAQPTECATVRNRARVAPNARLDWLPQETILYDGATLRRELQVNLAGDARLLMVEPLVFGRAAMGERLTDIRFHDRIEITRDGAPLYTDALALTGDAAAHLARPAVTNGAGAMANVIFAAPEAGAHLDVLRALMPATGGVSLIRPDLLAMRLLAADSHALRQVLLPVLTRLTDTGLPRSWMT